MQLARDRVGIAAVQEDRQGLGAPRGVLLVNKIRERCALDFELGFGARGFALQPGGPRAGAARLL
jgi:hypothetical protein